MRTSAFVCAAASLLILLPSCSSNRAYTYRCAKGRTPMRPAAPTSHNPHGTSQRFFALLDRACTATEKWDPSAELSQRFGRLLPPGELPADPEAHLVKLRQLAASMRDLSGTPAANVPAGMIFLGQFIDHDITLDVVSQLGEFSDPASIKNLRTPRLDLDSIYQSGPEGSPYLYAPDGQLLTEGGKDFRRIHNGRSDVALIGDPRNDENGLIAQLHLLFMQFHNRMLLEHGGNFEEAQRLVRWHYQWIVRNEFLPTIVDAPAIAWAEQQVGSDWHHGPGLWNWLSGGYRVPDMPVEFAAAAYRFGHSQVTDEYKFGPRTVRLFAPPPSPASLSSFGKVPDPNVVTDWGWFFDGATPATNRAAAIDTKIADVIYELPFAPPGSDDRILPLRNLIRGDLTFALPSGEAAADYLGVPRLPEDCGPIRAARNAGLEQTPLWFYVLAEAEQNGGVLTGVGGRIVALTLIRMLHRDADSYLNAAGMWQPEHGSDGSFTMADLVQFTKS